MNDPTFQKIATFQYTSEALILKGKLESEGIEVFVRDGNIVDTNPGYSNAYGGVKLFVRTEDLYNAKTILNEVSEHPTKNSRLLKCPKCGDTQMDMTTSVSDIKSLIALIFSLFFSIIPFYSNYKYKCNNCKFEFNKS